MVKKGVIITVLVSLLLVVMVMAGCGGAATSLATTTTAVTSTPPTTTTVTKNTAPLPTSTTQAPAIELNVSAASSLTDAIAEINKLYMQENKNITITTSFGSSGTLQKQIEQGAPSDVFISAGAKQMDALQTKNLIINETRVSLLKNVVVLVIPNNSTVSISFFADLTKDAVKKIAIGDPASVPAGDYGTQALKLLGIYDQVKSKLILCTDVRQVLSYVEAGNVEAGLVYSTDAATSAKVKIVANAPAEINDNIIYPGAVIKATKNADAAKAYLAFLSGGEAKAIFEKYGFIVVQ